MKRIAAIFIFSVLLFAGCATSKKRVTADPHDYRYISIVTDDINFGIKTDTPSIQSIVDSALERTCFESVKNETELSEEQKSLFLIADLTYDFNPVVRKTFVSLILKDFTTGETVAVYRRVFKKSSYSAINSCVMYVMNDFARANLRQ